MAGGPQPVSIHNSINLPIRKSRLKWIVELLNGPGQPPISSSPTNPNQADASLCLCVQFLIGGLYCYNIFFNSSINFNLQWNQLLKEKRKVIFLFEWSKWWNEEKLRVASSIKTKVFNYGVIGYEFPAQLSSFIPSLCFIYSILQ